MTDLTPSFILLSADREIVLPSPFSFGDTAQTVGGFMASPSSLTAGNVTFNSLGEQILVGQATASLTGIGVFIGNAGDGTYDFRAGDPAGNYIQWDASAAILTVKGTITATAGAIGGFNIGADYIRDAANSFGLASTVSAGDDVRFWAGAAFASRASAPFYVTESGLVVANTITATGTINAQGGYLGAPTTVLNISTSGLDIGVTGHIQGGASGYLVGTGFFLGYSGAAYKFSVGNPAGNYIAWDGTNLTINGYLASTSYVFGGDGTDGALSITSGVTTIDCGGANYVVKNYSSVSITGTGALAFSNPASDGTVVVIRCSGNVIITSSATRAIDLRSMGGTGGAGHATGTGDGTDGSDGFATLIYPTGGKGGLQNTTATPRGGGGAHTAPTIVGRSLNVFAGSGAGGGATFNSTGAAGTGGRGAGGLLIECKGALNITGTIDASGANGGNAAGTGSGGTAVCSSSSGGAGKNDGADGTTSGSTVNGAGGGSGGGGGAVVIVYTTLTANSGTYTVTAGTGGTGTGTLPNGRSGGNGYSLVVQNNVFL